MIIQDKTRRESRMIQKGLVLLCMLAVDLNKGSQKLKIIGFPADLN